MCTVYYIERIDSYSVLHEFLNRALISLFCAHRLLYLTNGLLFHEYGLLYRAHEMLFRVHKLINRSLG